jgi:hypothetical protein
MKNRKDERVAIFVSRDFRDRLKIISAIERTSMIELLNLALSAWESCKACKNNEQ